MKLENRRYILKTTTIDRWQEDNLLLIDRILSIPRVQLISDDVYLMMYSGELCVGMQVTGFTLSNALKDLKQLDFKASEIVREEIKFSILRSTLEGLGSEKWLCIESRNGSIKLYLEQNRR